MSEVLKISNLRQTFAQGTVNENRVLRGLDLTLAQGEFVTVIGSNGAGKSTLLNSIAGTIATNEGQIILGGQDITKQNVTKRAQKISRVFQDPKMGTAVRLTVEENLALALKRGEKRGFSLGVKKRDRQFFKEQLAMLDLNLENRLETEIGLLSGGQRQAITLLMATLRKPELILLDEHTAALDPHTSITVMKLTQKLISEQNLTALMVTHNMADAIKYGDRLIMLHQGKVAVDISGQKKTDLTVPKLMDLFQKQAKTKVQDEALLLS